MRRDPRGAEGARVYVSILAASRCHRHSRQKDVNFAMRVSSGETVELCGKLHEREFSFSE